MALGLPRPDTQSFAEKGMQWIGKATGTYGMQHIGSKSKTEVEPDVLGSTSSGAMTGMGIGSMVAAGAGKGMATGGLWGAAIGTAAGLVFSLFS